MFSICVECCYFFCKISPLIKEINIVIWLKIVIVESHIEFWLERVCLKTFWMRVCAWQQIFNDFSHSFLFILDYMFLLFVVYRANVFFAFSSLKISLEMNGHVTKKPMMESKRKNWTEQIYANSMLNLNILLSSQWQIDHGAWWFTKTNIFFLMNFIQ